MSYTNSRINDRRQKVKSCKLHLMYHFYDGEREDAASMCAKIDAVTKESIRAIVQKAIVEPPTLSAVGVNPSHTTYRYETAKNKTAARAQSS
jgi:hypothetical protein